MNIITTSSQVFVTICLLIGGFLYSLFTIFIRKLTTIDKFPKGIISFLLTIFGTIIYFTILYLTNSGEMRIFTIFSYIFGFYLGMVIMKKFSKQHNN